MNLQDLYSKTLGEVLEEYCIVVSPECGYVYGITTWDEGELMYSEFDLEEEYCYSLEPFLNYCYEIDDEAPLLTEEKLRETLNYLGVGKKEE